jgi:glycerol-3-phosphate dehydrogenase (NAD(P)+)
MKSRMSALSSSLSLAVIGAGSWGTTLAHHLAGLDHRVSLWAFEPEISAAIERAHENPLYLPGVPLHPALAASSSLESVFQDAALALFVTPSHVARSVVRESIPYLPRGIPIVIASKGIETDSLKTMCDVFDEELPTDRGHHTAFLSGPSFAKEVARGLPTAISVASRDPETAAFVQAHFSSETFRVYTNPDVTGVELGGALKNVIAIAAGISDGLELGHNARSALITRGLAEMTRLGVALGADERTFSGLSGLGDLVLTCTGDLSRNRTVGMKLGQGQKLKEILESMRMVAEGVKTTLATVRLARRLKVELPIAEQIHDVLYEDKDPREAIQELMTRGLRSEVG